MVSTRSTLTPLVEDTTDGPVAQLEARRFPKPEVAGSSPAGTATQSRAAPVGSLMKAAKGKP